MKTGTKLKLKGKELERLVKVGMKNLGKNAPTVMTAIGVAGTIVSVGLAIKATPKAMNIIKKKEIEEGRRLTKGEVVKETWKCYIPCAMTTVVSIGCMVGANTESVKRNAALAAAYTLSETSRKEYEAKVKEMVGETKDKKIKDAVMKDKIDQTPTPANFVIGEGKCKCYDGSSGRYFASDRNSIEKAVNEINRRLIEEMTISLNDFYYELGLDQTDIGDLLGWEISRGFLDVTYSPVMDDKGMPCLGISYNVIDIPRF